MITCPCCGGRGEIEERAPVELTPTQFKIFDVVRRAPHGITKERIVNHVYADRIDGGPSAAETTISVIIHQMNKRLAVAGLRIAAGSHGTKGIPYKLQRLA